MVENDFKRIQRDFQKAKTELFYSLEVSEAKWVLKQVKLEMNRLKVNLKEVKARKLKDLQEKVNFNINLTNDASHEGRKKTEQKIKLIRTDRCKKKNRRAIRKSKRRRRKYKKIQRKWQDVKQTEKWIEILKESSEVQKTLEQRRPLDNTNVEWTQAQLNLLDKGQKFIPTPKK